MLGRTDTLLRAVAGIDRDIEGRGGDALHGYRLKVVDHERGAAVGQAQCQLAVLKIEELATTVGGTHEEVVERLVVLHEVWLYEFRGDYCHRLFSVVFGNYELLLIFQESHVLDVCLDQRRFRSKLFSERQALRLQDARTKLFGHIGLAVFVERHQLVHTEDVQSDSHLHAVHVALQLRVQLKHVAVLGNGICAIAVERGVILPVDNLQFGCSFQEQVTDRLKRGCLGLLGLRAVGCLLHEVHLGLNLCRLVNLPVDLDAQQRDVV